MLHFMRFFKSSCAYILFRLNRIMAVGIKEFSYGLCSEKFINII